MRWQRFDDIVPCQMAVILPDPTHRLRLFAFFASLFIVEWYLYFWNIGHFFQADTIFLLYHRPKTILDVVRSFFELHASGWYRPLANDVAEAILFPILGLKPTGYRILVYALFVVDTIAVYALAVAITRRQLAAVIATFFFSVHTTNAYVTYDLAFLPELLYTLFYVLSVMAYLRHLEGQGRASFRLSLACFILSLLSKESAVTLPGVLVALHLFRGDRIAAILRSVRWHVVILAGYLFFLLGDLHVMNLSFERFLNAGSPVAEYAGFDLTLGAGILDNLDLAATWAFNIPRGWNTEFRNLEPALIAGMKAFRVFILALVAILLFTRERKAVLLSAAWFFLTLIPVLPLIGHLLPYYLFLPMVGFSLVIGMALTFVHDKLRKPLHIGNAVVVATLIGVCYVCSVTIPLDIKHHRLLGGSSDVAAGTLADLKALHPALPPGTSIYIDDQVEPLWWDHASGELIKMAYDTEDVSVYYSSLAQELPPENRRGHVIMLRYENKRLLEQSAAYSFKPGRESRLRLSKEEAETGDSYFVEMTDVRDKAVRLAYTLNSGNINDFPAKLDNQGRAIFHVSPETQKGTYRFVGFNIDDEPDWYACDATITVR